MLLACTLSLLAFAPCVAPMRDDERLAIESCIVAEGGEARPAGQTAPAHSEALDRADWLGIDEDKLTPEGRGAWNRCTAGRGFTLFEFSVDGRFAHTMKGGNSGVPLGDEMQDC
jgi:hypothetical protein